MKEEEIHEKEAHDQRDIDDPSHRAECSQRDQGRLSVEIRSIVVVSALARKLGLAVVAGSIPLALIACGGGSGVSARPTVTAFLSAWRLGRYQAAGRLTNAPRSAATELSSVASALNLRKVSFRLERVDQHGSVATAKVAVALTVGGLGVWRFATTVPLRSIHGRWRVVWTPSVIEPRLRGGEQLVEVRQLPTRAPILDRGGQPLFTQTPVVTVGVVPKLLKQRRQTLALLEQATGLDAASVNRQIAAAPASAFVPLITLRRSDYERIRAQVHPLPGVHFLTGTESLAPTRGFARPLLGFVGPATAEALRSAGPHYTAADALGLAGLQDIYQRRLA